MTKNTQRRNELITQRLKQLKKDKTRAYAWVCAWTGLALLTFWTVIGLILFGILAGNAAKSLRLIEAERTQLELQLLE